ncbi:hypothetical protein PAAG_04131 [Paracoccidioides lutzii Pb01]|uniref:Uncharacterized protein n=1 Tax=Paracoccidioides lutzii (strain ATCC MYA-826 / Pb01) TaxID=502779 RepID=C1H037_PARBA|nr:hypothetical protein PAAG_04131 [Paracoccidioides lutzii Pb01]EEH33078.1 hypothetical protein PAAG_04131 [Paracoccidioides lutzii Pb01]
MVLIASSTISVIISSSVISLFTALLFLSGYVLQQQTVRHIQASISPDSAYHLAGRQYALSGGSPAAAYVIVNRGKEAFSTPDAVLADDSRGRGDGEGEEMGETSRNEQGGKYGQRYSHTYVQIISKPSVSCICSSLLFFKILSSNSDIETDKVFLYPQSWDLHSPSRGISNAISLLRQYQNKYDIIMHAINTSDPNYRSPSNTRLLSRASHKLTHYKKIFYIRSPGMLLDSSKLNQLFLSPPPTLSSSSFSSSSPFSSWKKKRKSTDNSQSDQWVPTRLSTVNADLPYAFLVTTDHSSSGGVSIRSHVPIPSVKQSLIVPAVPKFAVEKGTELHPAYVFFEKDRDRSREMETAYYQQWKKDIEDICQGIDVND